MEEIVFALLISSVLPRATFAATHDIRGNHEIAETHLKRALRSFGPECRGGRIKLHARYEYFLNDSVTTRGCFNDEADEMGARRRPRKAGFP